MSLFDSLREISQMIPDQDSKQQEQLYYDPTTFANEFHNYKSEPTLYPNMTHYLEPLGSDNWGGVTGIMATFDEASRSPGALVDNRIDPNKIYTSELAALRSSAADQVRITKLFEKKLMEGLKDKDKFGLNENDILAMQALTAARSAVTGINKEMITIKKNISELRLKQQQSSKQLTNADPGVVPTTPGSIEMGHSMLDDVFNSAVAVPVEYHPSPQYDPQTVENDVNRAAGLLDDILPSPNVNQYAKYETERPTTYVMIGDSDDDVEFATFNDNGDLLEDYPNPISEIVEINREGGYAKDSLLRTYELKKK